MLLENIMYKKQEWNNGTRLDAFRLNHIEDGVYECSKSIEELKAAACDPAFQEFQQQVNKLIEELMEQVEKQKKEITTLKSRVTKLQKQISEE